MSADSVDLRSSIPLKPLTELDVVEAFAMSGSRGEVAVLDRFTPHMMQGALTKGALFQLAFHIEDSDVNADRGLMYSAILLHAATLVLQGDTDGWRELRTRPGQLGQFVAKLSDAENAVLERDRKVAREKKPRHVVPAPVHDLLDIVLTRLHFSFETLSYLYDHLQDTGAKSLVRSLLILRGREPVPGSA